MTIELKNGRRYELTRDVANPDLDKRERYDVSKLPWTKGDVFRATMYPSGECLLAPLYIQATPRRPSMLAKPIEALIEALEEIPESTDDICALHGVRASAVLERAHTMGMLTLTQVETICDAIDKEDPP